ncbi:fatty acid elongase [Trypanosoma theileri]|uniref:Elongation of fatty acids protein n=1 Tax=Trypanosoma theileri TaxID=67003 RepID=A0A1X0NNM5_9TRYP|nr:fatty acid elongase [Trypanosoma theileri]ORC86304.1 fatty acid elongase [Trypanosoma theileri]
MTESLVYAFNHFADNFQGSGLREWMREHTEVPVLAVVLYLALVLYVPDSFMAHRPAMNLRVWNILWNLFLTLFSMGGAYYCVPRLLEVTTAPVIGKLLVEGNNNNNNTNNNNTNTTPPVMAGNLYNSACYWNRGMFFDGPVGFWVAAFVLSKIPEMMDTVFLVLQKKPVIFLHWYHHATVMLFCWHGYAYTISSGLWFATMNYFVHSIMYFYYFVCACGFRKVIRPIAPLITALQILQMVVGTLIVTYTYTVKNILGMKCDVNGSSLRLGLLMYVSYLILFSQLFHRSYLSQAGKQASKLTNGAKKVK